MIELIPARPRRDKDEKYFIPHIQIDLDTTLSAQQIRQAITQVFKGYREPVNGVIIGNVVYVVRLWLGTVSGINFSLDFAVSNRQPLLHREDLLKKIV